MHLKILMILSQVSEHENDFFFVVSPSRVSPEICVYVLHSLYVPLSSLDLCGEGDIEFPSWQQLRGWDLFNRDH